MNQKNGFNLSMDVRMLELSFILTIDKREKGLETEANCKRIRVTAGCKVDAHAQ